MKIVLNGKETAVEGNITLSQLLALNKITPELVACELNQKIIRRKDLPNTPVSEGDSIEVLQMIGGG